MRYTNYNETFKKIYNILKIRTNNNELLNEDDLRVIHSLLSSYYTFFSNEYYYYDYLSYVHYFKRSDFPSYYFDEYDSSSSYGLYDYSYNYIVLFFNNILKETLKESNSVFIINLQILETYFHEFSHCMQYFYIDNNNLESIDDPYFMLQYLLHSMSQHITKNDNSTYDKIYDLIPSERMANIDALKYILYMLKKFEDDERIKKIGISYVSRLLYSEYLSGYEAKEDGSVISSLDAFLQSYLDKTDDEEGILKMEELKSLLGDCISKFEESYEITDEMKMYLGIDIPGYLFDIYKDMFEEYTYDYDRCVDCYIDEHGRILTNRG